jgi:hypothetical protein
MRARAGSLLHNLRLATTFVPVGTGLAAPSASLFATIGGCELMNGTERTKLRLRDWVITTTVVFSTAVAAHLLAPDAAVARDLDGRYANSPLKGWFESLHSSKGACCSDADGTALADVDWESRDGHYRVRIQGQWWDVPEEAVITEPNRAGRTMVWPIYHWAVGAPLRLEIRCFMPGSMT